jgi:trans-aconitate methyltransferase
VTDRGPRSAPPPLDPSSAEFFDAKYATCADPWDFAASTYEQQRYRDLLELIGDVPVDRAFEPGCSIGAFTELLAPRCRALVATDLAAGAVGTARRRCSRFDHVVIEVQALPDLPDGTFDLVVFSEVGYYLDRGELAATVRRLADSAAPGADFVACHWTGESEDHQLHGRDVHAVLHETLEPDAHVAGHVHDGFLLDAWRLP